VSKNKSAYVTVRISREHKEILQAWADKDSRTVSWCAGWLITDGIKRMAKGVCEAVEKLNAIENKQ
jgi:predicted transcriptional regulator